jgi:hypothetical protein
MSEDIDAVVAAIRDDNPDADVEVVDRGAYVRVHATGRLVVTEATLRAVDDGTADLLHGYQRYEGGLGRDPVSATKTP